MTSYVWRLFKKLFLLTLPITFLPLLAGTIAGLTFSIWHSNHIDSTTEKWMYDVKDAFDDWGFPGNTPTRRQYQDQSNNFHIMRVNNNDWTSKLSVMLPNEYLPLEENVDLPIDRYASLDVIMRDPYCASTMPKQQWMYLTNTQKPSTNEWDAAFDEAIQRAYVHPTLQHDGFVFTNCNSTGGFLCGIWATRAPALVHFIVEDEPPDPDEMHDMHSHLSYDTESENLRKVTARIIEFPLKDAYTGLPLNVFPSAKEQMLSIITKESMYEQFDQYSVADQTLTRFSEYMDSLWDDKGTVLNYINRADNWMVDHVTKPLGIEGALGFLHAVVFTVVAAINSSLIMGPLRLANGIKNDFLGKPRPGDAILGDLEGERQKPGFWDDLEDEAWTASLQRKDESVKKSLNDWMKTFFAEMSQSKEEAKATESVDDVLDTFAEYTHLPLMTTSVPSSSQYYTVPTQHAQPEAY